MTAIWDRELKAYFQSPLGYVFIGAMFLFSGYFFFAYNLYGNTTDMRAIFGTLFTVALFLIPILTMRLMSEDRKLKTDQLLLTAPVSKTGIVLGKFFAALCIYVLSIMSTMVIAVTISLLATPEWLVIFGHFTGLLLLGTALISITLFLSSLTESQVIAAIGGFSVSFFLMLIDTLAPVVSNKWAGALLEQLSFQNRYQTFTMGILSAKDIVFFLSITAFFLLLTIAVLEKRRIGGVKSLFWGLILILMVLVFLLNLVMSMLDTRLSLSRDLTSQSLYQISDESKGFLENLKDPVTIYILAKEDAFVGTSTYMSQVNRVIQEYDRYGSTLTTEYVNYVADPTFAAKYPDTPMSHGDILVASGKKTKVVSVSDLFNYSYGANGNQSISSSKAEQVLASAILNVTSNDQVVVTILTGNGEYSMPSLEALLGNNNFKVETRNLITEDIDPNCKIAILIAPHSDLGANVLSKLDQFLYNKGEYGKTLLYTADAEQNALPGVENLLREWGVEIGEGAVFETDSSRVFNYHPFYAVTDYVDEIYAGMLRDQKKPMLMPIARPLGVLYDYRNNNSVSVLLEFGDSAAVRPPGALESFTQKDATLRGPIPALVQCSYTVRDKSTGQIAKQSHILVSGSSGMLDAYSIENASLSNSEYLLNVFNTVSDRTDVMKVQSKTITGNELNLATSTANWIGLLFAFLIPLLIIGTGVVVWLLRRHR